MEEQARLGSYSVFFKNVTDIKGCVSIAGPKSHDVLCQLTKTDVSDSAFPFLTCQNIEIMGVNTLTVRISYTGKY
jgi:dimethylglycine dehydrogenase